MWVLTALQAGPRHAVYLLDDVRALDGPMGHGTLFAALARLEHLELVERTAAAGGRRAYRLTPRGASAAGSVVALRAGAPS
jgi:DNA-binding PadR family transcriptional regulator